MTIQGFSNLGDFAQVCASDFLCSAPVEQSVVYEDETGCASMVTDFTPDQVDTSIGTIDGCSQLFVPNSSFFWPLRSAVSSKDLLLPPLVNHNSAQRLAALFHDVRTKEDRDTVQKLSFEPAIMICASDD